MAFDGIITCAMVHELQDTILLGKIEKVYQPENDELVFHIHTKKGNVKLYASVNSARSCLHFIETNPANPPAPLAFCMLLRKHQMCIRDRPQVMFIGSLQGEYVVFSVVSSYQHLTAVGKGIDMGLHLIFLFFIAAGFSPAHIAGLRQFCAKGFYFFYAVSIVQIGKHRLQILNISVVFQKLSLLFLDGGLGLAVPLKILLGIFGRCKAFIQRNLHLRAVVIVDDFHPLVAGLYNCLLYTSI